jgi:hypothetical protein
LVQEIEGEVPEPLRAWWEQRMWAFHSADWLRRHWGRTGAPPGWPWTAAAAVADIGAGRRRTDTAMPQSLLRGSGVAAALDRKNCEGPARHIARWTREDRRASQPT